MRHPGTQNILTPRLLLRRAAPADAENCALHWASDPLVYRHISATPKTQREMEVFLASVEAAYADPAPTTGSFSCAAARTSSAPSLWTI